MLRRYNCKSKFGFLVSENKKYGYVFGFCGRSKIKIKIKIGNEEE